MISLTLYTNVTVTVQYTNWKGETAVRRITPKFFRLGTSEFHPEEQWFCEAWDEDKKAMRSFALRDIKPIPAAGGV